MSFKKRKRAAIVLSSDSSSPAPDNGVDFEQTLRKDGDRFDIVNDKLEDFDLDFEPEAKKRAVSPNPTKTKTKPKARPKSKSKSQSNKSGKKASKLSFPLSDDLNVDVEIEDFDDIVSDSSVAAVTSGSLRLTTKGQSSKRGSKTWLTASPSTIVQRESQRASASYSSQQQKQHDFPEEIQEVSEEQLWVDKYAPMVEEECVVHKKKIAELKEWLGLAIEPRSPNARRVSN